MTQDHRGTLVLKVCREPLGTLVLKGRRGYRDHREQLETLVLKDHRERKGYRETLGTLVLLVLVVEVEQGESQ